MTRLTRRRALTLVAATATVPLMPRIAFGQAPAGPFKLEPLPYANNALEPHIDARTMEIHHGRHHAAYVNNLEQLRQGPSRRSRSGRSKEVLAKLSERA